MNGPHLAAAAVSRSLLPTPPPLTPMWHPKPFTLHPIPPARWPDAAEAAASRWFSPLETGRLRLRERTWVQAVVRVGQC